MAQWPSAELKLPSPGRRRIASVVWWLLLALTVVAIASGVWRSIETIRSPNGFDRAGFVVESTDPCISVTPSSQSALVAWPDAVDSTTGACIVEVNGRAIDRSVSRDTVGSWLDGPLDTWVKVVLADDRGGRASSEFVRKPVGGWGAVGLLIIDTLAVSLYAAVAFLLWRRRGLDPVSRRISFAFLLVAHLGSGTMAFWRWAEMPLHYILGMVGVLIVIVTLPAYPNGVYVPRIARWLRILVPLGTTAAILIEAFAPGGAAAVLLAILILVLLVAGLLLLGVRYYRMPPSLEKQQIKWAVFGIGAGFVFMIAGAAISDPTELGDVSPDTFAVLLGLSQVFVEFGFAAIPAGVGISLFEYRLNDADAAVGKSLGYAIVTVVVGVVWALVQSVVSDIAKRWAGDPMATTAITTVIAALVFTPARAYVLSWTEARFQPALVHLRKLPEKLVRWQTCDSPDELAKAALADLVPGVGAAYAAVLGDDGREWRVLAAHGIEPEKAAALLAAERPADRRDDPFPIRRELSDQLGQPDLLAIGPRSDGASFTRDEKSAIALIVEPLSNAIEAAALRERHILKVEDSLAGIDHRLGRLEVQLAPLAEEAVSRRSPKGS
jgi:hypothetical protein